MLTPLGLMTSIKVQKGTLFMDIPAHTDPPKQALLYPHLDAAIPADADPLY